MFFFLINTLYTFSILYIVLFFILVVQLLSSFHEHWIMTQCLCCIISISQCTHLSVVLSYFFLCFQRYHWWYTWILNTRILIKNKISAPNTRRRENELSVCVWMFIMEMLWIFFETLCFDILLSCCFLISTRGTWDLCCWLLI